MRIDIRNSTDKGTVLINGVDNSSFISRVDVILEAGKSARVLVEYVPDVITVESEEHIHTHGANKLDIAT